jgi:hypothetical protein
MPNCFALTAIQDGEVANRTSLPMVDDIMRTAFGAEPSATEWYCGWYDTIGLGLAMGHSWDKLRDIFKDSERLLTIIEYLEQHYAVDTWYQVR